MHGQNKKKKLYKKRYVKSALDKVCLFTFFLICYSLIILFISLSLTRALCHIASEFQSNGIWEMPHLCLPWGCRHPITALSVFKLFVWVNEYRVFLTIEYYSSFVFVWTRQSPSIFKSAPLTSNLFYLYTLNKYSNFSKINKITLWLCHHFIQF